MGNDSRKTILLVEDEFVLLADWGKILEKNGYSVITANTGSKAVELFRDGNTADLILMDIDLGKGMDGTEAAEIILKDHDIPVVFLSSHTEPEIVEKMEKITSYGYVTKNSSGTVLDASLKMAFKLFEEKVNGRMKEQALAMREQFLQTVLHTTVDGFWVVGKGWKFTEVNDAYLAMSGYSREEFLDLGIMDIDASMSQSEAKAQIELIVKNGSGMFETRHRGKDGDFFDVEISVTHLENDEDKLVCFCRDITERKKAQETLEASRGMLRNILDNTQIHMWAFDGNHYIYMNKEWFSYTGQNPASDLTIERWKSAIHPDDRDPSNKVWMANWESKTEHDNYFRLRRRDGIYRNFHCHAVPIFGDKGDFLYFQGFNIDVTARTRAEETLATEKRRLADIINGTNVGTWEWNVQTGEAAFSKRWAEIIGYSLKEISPASIDTWIKFAHPDELKKSSELLALHFEGKTDYYECEARMRHKNGGWVWVLDRGKVVTWTEDKKPLLMSGTHQDITERKRAEITLKESELRYRTLVEGIPGIVYSFSDKRGGMFYSSYVSKLLGYSPEQLYSKPKLWHNSIHPDDLTRIDQVIREAGLGKPFRVEYRIRDLNNDWHWFDDRSLGSRVEGGEIFVEGLALDITDRKKSDERIMQASNEKEILLRELYHRTKNTMQLIRSMLVLQADEFSANEDLQTLVKNTEDRIQAISLVHSMLYKSQDLSKISVKEYINQLADLIIQGFEGGTGNVAVDIEVDDQYFLLDSAIPVGLILNELMTNSLKHAFPDKREGEISIKLNKGEGDTIVLRYSDNGVGVPDGFDFTNQETLGLKLIYGLADQQIIGKMTMKNNNGVSCQFEFRNNLFSVRV